MSSSGGRAVVYAGHHKCASQWMMQVLRSVAGQHGRRVVVADWRRPPTRRAFRDGHVVLLQDYEPGLLGQARPVRGVHLVRDPRDVLVSLLHSHRDSHAARDPRAWEILRDRLVLRSMSMSEGLVWLMDNSTYFGRVMDAMSGWDYHQPDFMELRYEEFVVRASPDGLTQLADHLGLALSTREAGDVLARYSFDRLPTAGMGRTGSGHYRSGGAATWRDVFDDDLVDQFQDRFGNRAAALGYPPDR